MNINIQGSGIELTGAIKDYARNKIQSLDKFFDNIQQADVDVGMKSSHHNKGKVYYAEVNLHVPLKNIRCVKDADDLYKAIDKVKDHLKEELIRMKEKMRLKDKKSLRKVKEYNE